jgi:hypothetical protein
MRTILPALFERTDAEISEALRNDDARAALRDDLNQNVLGAGKLGAIPVDQYGDNLLQGLLAYRTKFDYATAVDKLELNLSMRARSAQSGRSQ